ncbi:GNAT family N-acetyltransferase [Candidatus Palauibacter sp.]|uniref:GNAT family N-acetyltransferase n=1 Tax=Candidatus Palauibacter sp. TaxID=3101350 RepID=UPI003B598301
MADTHPSTARRIAPVEPGSILLPEVISLGRENAKTLGFFPDGAFQDYASRGHLLACVQDQRVAGYLTFRKRHLTITLVHLCVAPEFRQGGIAKALIDHLSQASSGFAGILARCRVDFPADAIWPHLGFTARNEIPGRATRQPTTLRVWWRDFGLPDLFSTAPSDRIVAALDSNVLFDLHTDRSEPELNESKALLADWLGDSIEYVVTDEVFTEIVRHPAPQARHALQAYASTFRILSDIDPALVRKLTTQLTDAIGPGESPQDESDRRHLVLSVVSGGRFFVTRDTGLLDFAADIDASIGLTAVRPCDLIARTHAELTEQSFTPDRLSGSALSIRPYRAADIDDLAQTFQAFGHHEPKPAFVRTLRDSLAQSTQSKGRIVVGQDGTLQGLLVVSSVDSEARIRLLRTTRGAASDVLARHLVWLAVQDARRAGRGVTRLVDEYVPPAARSVLGALGFRPADEGMAKVNGIDVMSTRDLADRLRSVDSIYPDPTWIEDTARVLEHGQSRLPSRLAFECERVIWPAKLLDTALPSYIVPIRPEWAAQLFHAQLAEQSLFRSDPSLMLRLNNVYYRSSIPRRIEAPARILWYVTASRESPSTRCVAATSLVEEIVRGPAKEVFSRFKRYGVFRWEDVLDLANNDPFGSIEAFRFGHTEPFETPVDLGRVRVLAEQVGAEMPVLQSPSKVPTDLFSAIYREGFQSRA